MTITKKPKVRESLLEDREEREGLVEIYNSTLKTGVQLAKGSLVPLAWYRKYKRKAEAEEKLQEKMRKEEQLKQERLQEQEQLEKQNTKKQTVATMVRGKKMLKTISVKKTQRLKREVAYLAKSLDSFISQFDKLESKKKKKQRIVKAPINTEEAQRRREQIIEYNKKQNLYIKLWMKR